MSNLQLGKRNQLKVLREKDHGVYLEGGDIGDILLPKRYVPQGTKVGDILDVFLYLDQEERLIATTEHPLIEVGQFAYLECTWTNEYGAYLNWGLMKDLFCPFREQKVRMQRGKRYQVYCYIDDKTYRIVCSSKIEKFQKAISEKQNPNPTADHTPHCNSQLSTVNCQLQTVVSSSVTSPPVSSSISNSPKRASLPITTNPLPKKSTPCSVSARKSSSRQWATSSNVNSSKSSLTASNSPSKEKPQA